MQRLDSLVISVVVLLLLVVHLQGSESTPEPGNEFDSEITRGDAFLSAHDTKQARERYSAAIKLCTNQRECSKGYLKRAAVWSDIHKYERAIDDFRLAIEQLVGQEGSARYSEAHLGRARAELQLGLIQESLADVGVAERAANTLSAENKLELRKTKNVGTTQKSRALKIDSEIEQRDRGQAGSVDTEALLKKFVDPLLEASPYARKYLLVRMRLNSELQQAQRVIDDAGTLIKMNANDADAYCWRGKALFESGDPTMAKKFLKEGMSLDPEQRQCKTTWKSVKAFGSVHESIAREYGQNNCVAVLAQLPELLQLAEGMPAYLTSAKEKECTCLAKEKRNKEAATACNEAVRLNDKNTELLLTRAEVRLALAEFAAARADFQRVQQLDPHNGRAAEGLKRSQTLEKQAKSRDYYKILDVPRDATAKQIKKAYHALVKIWHPDKAPEDKREEASAKFKDIKDAYDVLSDENKRAMFNRGEDPFDTTPQQQQHHHQQQFHQQHQQFHQQHQQFHQQQHQQHHGHPGAGGFQFHGFPGGFPGFGGFNGFQFRHG